MKRLSVPTACLLCAVALTLGCNYSSVDEGSGTPDVNAAVYHLCAECGQVQGSVQCCDKGAEICTECELIKGSPGCCKMTKGDDVHLCAECGFVEESENCCQPDAENCEKCGKHKGSPLCCVVFKEGAEHNDDHDEH